MPRRPDPRQLDLPSVPVAVRPVVAEREARTASRSPWDDVRHDVLVAALLEPDGRSARELADAAGCSPDTIARTRNGRTPRPALRARLIGLAWDRLEPDALAGCRLPPEPGENLRWHTRERFAPAHAFRAEPAIGDDVVSLCGFQHVGDVDRTWSTTPDEFAVLCPSCLARARDR